MIVTGVDTGMKGALATVAPDGSVLDAQLLRAGPRQRGWKTHSPREVANISGQLRRHLEHNAPDRVAYERISATRGIAAARSLFICEGLLLAHADELGLPVDGVQQQTLRAWVKRHLGIAKWKKGQGKQQILDAMDRGVMGDLLACCNARLPTGANLKQTRYDDVADAYLTARWCQLRLQEEADDE